MPRLKGGSCRVPASCVLSALRLKGVFRLKELIEYLVKALVDEPAQVDIREVVGEESTTFEIRVAPNDLGKVIGKQGKIANALRTVAKAAAMREKKRVYLEIIP